ncbi:MAG: Yip1 family protein [Chlamydiales bacterium]
MPSINLHPWYSVWISPRKTMQSLLKAHSKKTLVWLALIQGGLCSLTIFPSPWQMVFFDKKLFFYLFFLTKQLILGGILGLAHLYLGGWLYKITGSWLGGNGSFIDLKCAVGWSNYPFIIAQLTSYLGMWTIFTPQIQLLFSLITVLIIIWAFVILVNLIGEAHHVSNSKGFLILAIGWILLFTLLMIMGLTISVLVGIV